VLLADIHVHNTFMQAAEFFQDIELVNKFCDLLAHRLFKASSANSGSQQPGSQRI
jgi:hypothetical protein